MLDEAMQLVADGDPDQTEYDPDNSSASALSPMFDEKQTKHVMYELKKLRRLILDDTQLRSKNSAAQTLFEGSARFGQLLGELERIDCLLRYFQLQNRCATSDEFRRGADGKFGRTIENLNEILEDRLVTRVRAFAGETKLECMQLLERLESLLKFKPYLRLKPVEILASFEICKK